MVKRPALAFILTLLLFSISLHGQTNAAPITKYFPSLPPKLQRNVVVLVDMDNPQPCPPAYTNLLCNTNLLSPAESKLIHKVMLKYKSVATNSGPVGSVFEKTIVMESRYKTFVQS